MKEIKIHIANKPYKVKLAESEEEHSIGLQGVENLPKNEGMLFVFEEPRPVSMWMQDTLIPLDVVFIDPLLEVRAVYQGVPGSTELMSEEDTYLVLEVNPNSGIKVGDELEFSPDAKVKSDKMMVLNVDGTPQMELEGGERIFSRPNTKILIKFAKKAAASNKDSDYKALGERVFKFISVQDENEPEYVQLKK